MGLINIDKFIKEYKDQEGRSKKLIEAFLIRAGFNNINYAVKKEIIIIDEIPKIKITITELPEIYYISDANKDTPDIDYKVVELSKFKKTQSESIP